VNAYKKFKRTKMSIKLYKMNACHKVDLKEENNITTTTIILYSVGISYIGGKVLGSRSAVAKIL